MKNIKSKIIVYLVGLFMIMGTLNPTGNYVMASSGTDYYVDSVGGNDSNSGTSENQAFKTLAKLNTITFQGGDKILFKAGGYWSGEFRPQGSGDNGSPIIVDKYGEGELPIIDGSGALQTIFLDGQEYWEFHNLHVKNYTTDYSKLRAGFYIIGTDCGVMNHIYIKNCKITDVVSKGTDYAPGSVEGMGTLSGAILMRILGTSTPSKFNDLRIEDNYFTNCDRNIFYLVDSNYWDNFRSTNVVIKNNVGRNIPADGFCLCSCDRALVENNILYNNNTVYPLACPAIPMSTWRCNDTIFQYNEVCITRNDKDCQAFDIDGHSRRCIVQYNYSRNNEGGFFNVCTDSSCPSSDNIVRYNISQNDGLNDCWFYMTAHASNTKIYNNTVFQGPHGNASFFGVNDYGHDVASGSGAFYNNIFINRGASMNPNKGNFHWDNNVFYGNFSDYPNDANKITTDPKLVAPGLGGDTIDSAWVYKLRADSPCIDSGKHIDDRGNNDIFGNVLGTADIGAHEFSNDVSGIPVGVNVALNSTVNGSGSWSSEVPGKAVDGTTKNNSKWTTFNSGDKWLEVDLGREYTLDRWVVKHAGAGGEDNGYNTKDFKLQKSDDKTTWVDVDSVTNNTSDITDRNVNFTARYVRLYITTPTNNNDTTARIYEFELYNVLSNVSDGQQITITSHLNEDAFSFDSNKGNGDFDGNGYTYAADEISSKLHFDGILYSLESFVDNSNNSIRCNNQTITITSDSYKKINLLGSATGGSQTGTFRINYSDSTYTDINVTMADWCSSDASSEKVVARGDHRHSQSGGDNSTTYIYVYELLADSNKTVTSITLPNDEDIHVMAITAVR